MVISAIFSIIILAVIKLSLAQLFAITAILNAIFGLFLCLKLKNMIVLYQSIRIKRRFRLDFQFATKGKILCKFL